MSDYTKGPWRAEKSNNTFHVIGGDNVNFVTVWGLAFDSLAEFKANAHLISAAPEMYEALKRDELLANVAILATPSGPKRNKLTEINLLRLQALAKAEGKS